MMRATSDKMDKRALWPPLGNGIITSVVSVSNPKQHGLVQKAAV